MPVYAIAQGRVHDPKKHDAYVAAAVPTLPAAAKLLSFDLNPEVIEGPVSHPRMVIIEFEFPAAQTQPLKHDGKVYRVTPQGKLKLVASGFLNPGGLRFVGTHLWATDVNGDFIAGMRELPDGFLVQLDPM